MYKILQLIKAWLIDEYSSPKVEIMYQHLVYYGAWNQLGPYDTINN